MSAGSGKRLDREAFADAIARGATTKDAVVAAGSRARSHGAQTSQAQRLLAEPEVQDLITRKRKANAAETYDDWRESLRVLAEIRDNPNAKDSDRLKAVDLFAKIGGHYAASKHEHSGPGGGPISIERREKLDAIAGALGIESNREARSRLRDKAHERNGDG